MQSVSKPALRLTRTALWTAAALCLVELAADAARWANAADAGTPSAYRIWNDATGQHQTEAKLLDFEDGNVSLKKKDGSLITIPAGRLSAADQDYVRQWAAPRQPASTAPAEASPNDRKSRGRGNVPATALPRAKEVVVTGDGTDADKALQNAFSQAIEQTVGVLVDAETAVKNDQLIRDEVLTFSRGYVEKYEVVKRWQEDGVHHATIQAAVARDKLVEKLKGMKIAMREVAGELKSRKFEFDAKNEKQATEMLRKALSGFDMTKLTKVEIVGDPQIARDGAGAKVSIKARVSPDLEKWDQFSKQIALLLSKTATKHGGATTTSEEEVFRIWWNKSLMRQLAGEGMLVALLSSSTPRGEKIQWKIFRIPGVIAEPIKDAAKEQAYRVAFVLTADDETEVARGSEVIWERTCLGATLEGQPAKSIHYEWDSYTREDECWLGPVWYWGMRVWACCEVSTTIVLSQADLARVVKTAVFLEKDTTRRR